jgi:hypothetical protein
VGPSTKAQSRFGKNGAPSEGPGRDCIYHQRVLAWSDRNRLLQHSYLNCRARASGLPFACRWALTPNVNGKGTGAAGGCRWLTYRRFTPSHRHFWIPFSGRGFLLQWLQSVEGAKEPRSNCAELGRQARSPFARSLRPHSLPSWASRSSAVHLKRTYVRNF